MIRINIIKNKKAQAVVEFSLLLVLAVLAYVSIHMWLNRALQGRLRSSTDSIGTQFSPGHTRSDRVEWVATNTTEQAHNGIIVRNTEQAFLTTENQIVDSFVTESTEL